MTINKSFVVKNGLQVAGNLIFTSVDLGNVGVGTTIPSTTLEVRGQGIKSQDALFTGIVTASGQSNLTDLSVSGVSTLGTLQVSSGVATASSGIITYYGDGSNLTGVVESIGVSSDSSFVGSGVTIINFIGGDDVSVTVEKSGTSANVTINADPNLDLTNVVVTGIATIGIITDTVSIGVTNVYAENLYGDASNVTGITTSVLGGTNINVDGVTGIVTVNLDDTINITGANISGVGTIATADVTNLTASGVSTLGTVQISSDVFVTGLSTFASNVDVNASVDISSNLTVDGLSDLDELNVAGIATFASDLDVNASVDVSSNLTVDGLSDLDELNVAGIATFASDLDVNASVDISNNLNVAGVVTATTFSGDGSALTGLPVGSIGIQSAGTIIGTAVTTLNFIGAGNTFKITGTTVDISIDSAAGGGGVASTITVTDESADTTCFPIFSTEATGDINPKTGSNLNFNSADGTLTATTFSGSGASLTSIPNSALDNSTISGVSLGSNLGTLTMNVSGTGLSGSDTYDGSANTTFTVTSNATNSNTASTIVARDGSGNFSAGTITATLSGNADTATTATNANNINVADESTDTSCNVVFTTGATGNLAPKTGTNLTFNSADGTLTATTFSGSGASLTSIPNGALTNSTISGISLGSNLENLTPGNFITGSVYNGANARTFAVDATSTNTVSKVVARDGSGNFSAGTITATLSGNADTATTATNATNITLADESSDATCFPVFATGATGNQAPKTDSSALTYNASTGTLAATNVNSTSDANLKENIETIVGSIDILKDINGVRFVWKDLGTPSVGVIAQDVEKVLPELVSERDDTGTKSVNYNGLVGVLIEAVKELSTRVSKLENK